MWLIKMHRCRVCCAQSLMLILSRSQLKTSHPQGIINSCVPHETLLLKIYLGIGGNSIGTDLDDSPIACCPGCWIAVNSSISIGSGELIGSA